MDLPRIASHTSISPTNIELLNYNHTPETIVNNQNRVNQRTPVPNRRFLSAYVCDNNVNVQPHPPQFNNLSAAGASFQPSRKREEACALQNLKKRVQALRLLKANQQESVESNNVVRDNQELDNRPQLFQKIISNRPVSMVLDSADLRTAWQDSDFITDCLCWHNVYRQRHSAPPLTMSTELCHYAQTWANHLAHTNTFYYRIDKDVGQNLFCRPSNALQTDVTGQEVSSYWYSAVRQYDYGKEPDVLHANVNAGHFTQLVWVKSSQFGVGKARSRTGKVIVVAIYSPAGNISGLFEDNVLPPQPDCPQLPPPPTYRTVCRSTENSDSESSVSTSTR